MSERIAIIGAGWAGLAAAMTLAQAGKSVTVYEAAKIPGGRARRLFSADEPADTPYDNGLHLLIGAYSETLRLMELASPGSSESGFLRLPLTLDYPDAVLVRTPGWPAPLHLAAALLFAHGLSLRDKFSAVRFMANLRRQQFDPPETTVAQALAEQPPKVRKYLWEPLCVAALNTPIEIASFKVFARVLKDALTGTSQASQFLIARQNLSGLFADPAANWIRSQGGHVHTRHRLRALHKEHAHWRLEIETPNGKLSSTHPQVILATSPTQAQRLLAPLSDSQGIVKTLQQLAFQPIVTVYARFPTTCHLRTPLMGWVDPVPLFLFDLHTSHGEAGLVAAVASASGAHEHWDDVRWQAEIHSRMQQATAQSLPLPVIAHRIVEKHATFACTAHLQRLPHQLPWSGLYLAGDHTQGPYPSTLEGAVRSGVQCAQILMADT